MTPGRSRGLRVYEAWLLRDGGPERAACFEPHNGTAAMSLEDSVEGTDAVAVTVEPSGGSSTPTSEPLLIAALKPCIPDVCGLDARGRSF